MSQAVGEQAAPTPPPSDDPEAALAATGDHAPPPVPPPPSPLVRWRLRRAAIMLAITALCLNSSPGLIVPDTKLDLTENPWGFLARSLHLWERNGFAGQLQDQAFGYLFPMGPFFGIGSSLGLPPWVVQRLWWALVLCVAFGGMTLLIDRMRFATPVAATLAGLAYAGSPHLVTVLGPVSAEIWPMAVAPLVLAPLVNPRGDVSPRRVASLSAAAVLCMGCVNATAVAVAVLPTGLWLVTRPMTRRNVRVLLWWVGAVLLACLWWLIPLLTLGRYSPPFLDYIENAAVVTSTTTLFESLRGTADWTAYLPMQGWTAGSLLLTQGSLVLCTALVVVGGLVGLCRRGLPHARFLVGLLLLGVLALGAGYVGHVQGLWPVQVRGWLDGALAPLRNVHKFDLFIRMPLVIGLAHVLSHVRWGATAAERKVTRTLSLGAAAVVIVAAAAPAAVLKLAPAGGYAEVPTYWRQAASWLSAEAPTERALVVPGARFAFFEWGRPKDDPLQPLATSPWEVRDAVPMVPPNHIRMLNAVGALFDTAQPDSGLAPYLVENGVDLLVVRNDLDYGAAGAPRPAQVHAVLEGSPGITRVASFGPAVGSVGNDAFAVDEGLQQTYPAVEIFRVDAGQTLPRARLVARSDLSQVAGGPEAGLTLAGEVGTPRPAILSGDLRAWPAAGAALKPPVTVVSDSLRRKDVTFGRNDNAASQTLTATEAPRVLKKVRDYLPDWASDNQTVAVYAGIAGVSASTSASDASASGSTASGDQPFAALDHDAGTAWRTAPVTNPVGQWLQVDLEQPTAVPDLDLSMATPGQVTKVTIDTGITRQSVTVGAPGVVQHVRLESGAAPIRFVRVGIDAVQSENLAVQQVGIQTLDLAGVDPTRFLRVPAPATPGPVNAFTFSSGRDGAHACLLLGDEPICSAGLAHEGEDAAGLNRIFGTTTSDGYDVSTTVVPRPGGALDATLADAIHSPVAVRVSSRSVPDPLAGPLALTDADPRTTWVAAADDKNPRATFTFATSHKISSLSLDLPPSYAATAPGSLTISNGSFTQTVPITDPHDVPITPVAGKQITIDFHASGSRVSLSATGGFPIRLGVGVSGVSFDAIPSTARYKVDTTTVRLPCGSGPDLVVDGERRQTSVTATVRELRELRPVPAAVCAASRAVELGAGEHRLLARSNGLFEVQSVSLTDQTYEAATRRASAGTAGPSAQIVAWTATSGTVRLPARDEASVLIVNENSNPGWRASLDGRVLTPIDVDGWQQGYVTPAGAAGVVRLTYAPDRTYRVGLLVGVGAVLLLLGLLLVPARRRATEPIGVRRRRVPQLGVAVLTGATLLAVGGWLGVATGVVVLAAGWWLRDRPSGSSPALAALAGSAYLATGLAVAAAPVYVGSYQAPHAWVQVCCLVAISAVAANAVLSRRPAVQIEPAQDEAATSTSTS